MDIEANVRSIEKLKDFYFVVPDYQREFVWETDDQVEQFLFDIDNEYDPHADPSPSYFIGSIIIVAKGGKYDVIDGQQRLTTIVLTMCAIRELLGTQELSKTQEPYFRSIKQWLMDFDMDSKKTRVRLELQYEESKDFLARLIEDQPYDGEASASIERMQGAYGLILEHFKAVLDTGLDALLAYVRYFLTRIELVVIETENLSSALKIFETINQRGAGLNAMDLVKNLLFSEARESEFSRIKETWKRVTTHLENCGENQSPLRFLKYFLVARYHRGVLREDEIYKWITSNEGKATLHYQEEPLRLARELEQMAERYSALVQATDIYSGETRFPGVRNIGYINKYRSRQHLVLLLALPRGVDDTLIDYLGIQIETFLFFSNCIGVQGHTNEQSFARWAAELRHADSERAISDAVKNTMLPYLRDRLAAFRSSFSSLPHTAFNPQYRQRFVLGRLENRIRYQAGLGAHGHDFIQSLQVEHILPQTPRNGELPAEFEDRETYDAIVARLGNVTLLEPMINQAVNHINDLNTDWFARKQAEYAKSDVVSTNLLNTEYHIGKDTALNRFRDELGYRFTEWNTASIDSRQRVLMDLAFDTWRLCGKRLDEKVEPTE